MTGTQIPLLFAKATPAARLLLRFRALLGVPQNIKDGDRERLQGPLLT